MLKKLLLFVFVINGFYTNSYSRVHNDSLTAKLERPDDTLKINILLQIASVYNKQHNANLYIRWLKEALNVSLKLKNTKYNAICYDKLSEIMGAEHIDNPVALSYAYLALQSYKENNQDPYIFQILIMYLRIGLMYADIQHNEVAWIYLDSASLTYKKLVNTKNKSVARLQMAHFYSEMNDYNNALRYINETHYLASLVNDYKTIADALRAKSKVLRLRQQYAKALKVNDTILDFSSAHFYNIQKDPCNLNDRGKIYFELGEYKKAIQCFNLSLLAGIESGSSKWQIDNYYDLANSYIKLSDLKTAKEFAFKSLRMASQNVFMPDILKNYILVSHIYECEKKYTSAYHYLKKYKLLKDSLDHPYRSTHITSAVFKNEIEVIRKHNVKLTEENQAKSDTLKDASLKNTLLIGILILMGVMILFISRLYLRTVKQKSALYEKNELIEEQNREIAAINEKLKENNETLTQTIDERNDLIAIVSHDLKAPLGRAFGLVQVIEMKSDELSDDHKKMFTKLKKELSDESNLISEILNAEALDNELKSVTLELIDVNIALMADMENYRVWAAKKEIKISCECIVSRVLIHGHETYFRRIMDNLVSNAIKFSNKGTSVLVQVNTTKDTVTIEVHDEGQGFSEDDKKRLFKRFHKLSARPTAGENSTGLGLSIVQKLVEALNGKIKLQSQKGKGSIFTLEFPKA